MVFKDALEEENMRHQKELIRLHHRIQELRSKEVGTRQMNIHSTTFSTDLNIDRNEGSPDSKSVFNDAAKAHGSLNLGDEAFTPISARSLFRSEDGDVELRSMG